MKTIVFSDAHGNKDLVERILDYNVDADYIISLGDSGLDTEFLVSHDIVHVKGNISRDAGIVYDTDMQIEGLNLFLTHGHKFKVHKTLDKLIKHGVVNNYDVVMFGHTHEACLERHGTVLAINPGSCASPRNTLPPTYAILDIKGKNIQVTFKDVLTNSTIEL